MTGYLDLFAKDVRSNESLNTVGRDFEYRLPHHRALEHASAIERLRELENGYPAAKPGEHITNTAKRVHELGFKKFVHNDKLHKVKDYLPYVGWYTHTGYIDSNNWLGQVRNENDVVVEARDGFSSKSQASAWAEQKLQDRKRGLNLR